MMSFKIKHQLLGGHVHVNVWSSEFGPETTRGHNGRLVFRPEEWDAFRALLEVGASETVVDAPSVEFEDRAGALTEGRQCDG